MHQQWWSAHATANSSKTLMFDCCHLWSATINHEMQPINAYWPQPCYTTSYQPSLMDQHITLLTMHAHTHKAHWPLLLKPHTITDYRTLLALNNHHSWITIRTSSTHHPPLSNPLNLHPWHCTSTTIINHHLPLLTITCHYQPSLTNPNHYQSPLCSC